MHTQPVPDTHWHQICSVGLPCSILFVKSTSIWLTVSTSPCDCPDGIGRQRRPSSRQVQMVSQKLLVHVNAEPGMRTVIRHTPTHRRLLR